MLLNIDKNLVTCTVAMFFFYMLKNVLQQINIKIH